MARAKATSLKKWQKEISKEEYEQQVLAGHVRNVGFNANLNKYYETDFSNADYLKTRAEKVAKKRARIANLKKNEFERGIKKGKLLGKREFIASEQFQKLLAAAGKKAVAATKPKRSLADRAAKAEAKAKEFAKKAAELKAKVAKN